MTILQRLGFGLLMAMICALLVISLVALPPLVIGAIGFIVVALVAGLIGWLAEYVVPGRPPFGRVGLVSAGLVGLLGAGLLGAGVGSIWPEVNDTSTVILGARLLVMGIVVAIVLGFIVQLIRNHRNTPQSVH
ncbi:MAG: hypothetical protein CL878_06020 [Dehalococcoidia bacterium]|nr:hypothetical protein [Dehalococcoidia bacterium]